MELQKALVDKICYEINHNMRIAKNKETLKKATLFIEDNALESLQTIENRDFNLELTNLREITDKQAEDISKFKWFFIEIWGLEGIKDTQLVNLLNYKWRIEIWWFNNISENTLSILKNFNNDLFLNFECRKNISSEEDADKLVIDVKKCLDNLDLKLWFIKIKIDCDWIREFVKNELSNYSPSKFVIK